MTVPTEVADLTATELLASFRRGELSPVEAAKAALERIRAFNPTVNAFCLVDEERTLHAARASEKRYRAGEADRLLDGVPVAIKDVFMTRGWPTLKGSKVIDPNQNWDSDAPAIKALQNAGYVPLGKTTTPEFGWKGVTDSPLTGITRNPWDPTRTAGGSSGGSAAAVPLGMGPLALGTDAGGSIRIPSGFSGLFGLKPTQGRIPMWPGSPFGFLAHPGPMTRTVEDAALLMDVLKTPDPRDTTLPPENRSYRAALEGDLTGLRIAFSPDLGYVEVDPQIAESVRRAVRAFEDAGAVVEESHPGFSDPAEPFWRLFFGGAANAVDSVPVASRPLMDPNLIASAEPAARLSALDYMHAVGARDALMVKTGLFHQEYDLLITPTLPIPAFTAGREVPENWPHERWYTWTPFTYPFNLTGQPAASVPCGFTEEGLPIGLQIIGARHRDALVLKAAHLFQQARPLYRIRPPLLQPLPIKRRTPSSLH